MHDDFPVIFTENLTKSYEKGSIKALDGVNLVIERGDFVSIIGPSGSGKSTLLNMLGGLDKPTAGTVIIDGVDITKEKDLSELRSDKVGFIFQLHNLIPNLNALDNVEIPLIGTGMKEKEMKQRAKYLLEAVGLGDRMKQKPNKLSGGQRQRIAIARALVNNPSIILADEPTGSLDTKTGARILDLLRNIQENNNVTLIIVTHDPEVAAMANRTIKIRDGRIIEDVINKPEKYAYKERYSDEAYGREEIYEDDAYPEAYGRGELYEDDAYPEDDKAQRFRNRAMSLENAASRTDDRYYENEYYPEYETDYDDGEYVYIDDSDDWIVPIHNEAEYDPEALDEYYSQDDVYIDYDSDSEEKELKEEIYAKFLDDIDEEQ